ncbi:MmpS family transport accessory protein [Mycobacteroides abscessus]|uniref:MmpS family transport accessory protein n=1 Tax=Mycobacteroides abscessus TaxID=36809 RepID=UPI0004CEBB4B|nr:MmpS family transport accessory protein [Mycobacteroides abscessus]MBN7548409.1 transport acessory protein MmpS [Mycobacteroides abscessus subsp. abscessus]MDM2692267.1 MmpS family transport accessory protein [Mycobacteroides abscessus]MDM2697079.1 MmpS family transport accessory protein [Mycobacteroides abscessus]MDM2702197.1 MmpS family transport accessory protein [Mycobacteroides abscessus]MDO3265678.1 MmpS family transport accessory protein [Mycobacteroides abscessus subsp. abscessus]
MKGVKGFALLGRLWVPLVVVVSCVVGGFAVYRLHGVFGSDQAALIGGGRSERIVHISPKSVTYELFGPVKSSGMISYLDEHAQPQKASFDMLPWSHTITTTLPSVFANIIAQGDSASLSCRITVNGKIREEQTSTKPSAQAFCLVKAA